MKNKSERRILEGLIDVELILDFMQKNRLSKTAFAKTCGISTALLTKILSGYCNIGITKVVKIAKAMGIKFTQLIKDDKKIKYNKTWV